jgi:hypothetical protein
MRFVGFYLFAAGRMSRQMEVIELVSVPSSPEAGAWPVALVSNRELLADFRCSGQARGGWLGNHVERQGVTKLLTVRNLVFGAGSEHE